MSSRRSIPFFDYKSLFQAREGEYMRVLQEVLSRGAFILQEDLARFERNLADYIGVRHAVGVADGTNALRLALLAAGIGDGDEVILPAHTYVATAAAIHYVGARLVLADCGDDHLIDPDSVLSVITSRTRAILPVHLNGRTADMARLLEIAQGNGLVLIEDAAQALGSRFGERHAGTFGVLGAFSFYPSKLLGCFGDGGAVVTNDDKMAESIRLLRNHGRNQNGDVVTWGTNCRLDNVQAAILDYKLSDFDNQIAYRRTLAARYIDGLKEVAQVHLPPGPQEVGRGFDVYQNFEIEVESRDELREHLQDCGIGTIVQFGGRAIHQHPLGVHGSGLDRTELLYKRALLLPMHATLAIDDVEHIIASVKLYYGE